MILTKATAGKVGPAANVRKQDEIFSPAAAAAPRLVRRRCSAWMLAEVISDKAASGPSCCDARSCKRRHVGAHLLPRFCPRSFWRRGGRPVWPCSRPSPAAASRQPPEHARPRPPYQATERAKPSDRSSDRVPAVFISLISGNR